MPKLLCANPLCGEEVTPSSPFKRDCVYDGKKWWHFHCFQKTFPKKNIEKWLDKTEKYLNSKVSTDELEQYLKKHYNISLLSSFIKKRIEGLSKGSDGAFTTAVDQALLLKMFKYYSNELEQMALYRRNSGIEGMVATSKGEPCLRYDLNYILSKYNEYLSDMSKRRIDNEYSDRILNMTSPNMAPVYKEQERKRVESGQRTIQSMMDSYWDEQD